MSFECVFFCFYCELNKGVSKIYEWLEFNALTERSCACHCNGERISGLGIFHLVQYGGATITVGNAPFTVCMYLNYLRFLMKFKLKIN